jgi:6-phosphogluconate dehydrogenase
MDIGFIGLGKMGGNMVKRLLARDVRPTVYDVSKSAVQVATGLGAAGADSVMDVVTRLKERPRVVWLMLPARGVVCACSTSV